MKNRTSFLLSRRRWLLGAAGVMSLRARRVLGAAAQRYSANPFSLGVASGDPEDQNVVLWTRLAPDPLEGGGMPLEDIEVRYRVATDDRMQNLVLDDTTIAIAELAHSVHVVASGLQPGREYWYQFSAGNEESEIGRTRTAPAPGASLGSLNFAYASCQHYEHGFFAGHRFLAEEDLDLIIHLGDYIYEYGPGELTPASGRANSGRVRQHSSREVSTLREYRDRYALYKSDPDLKAAHAAAPWLVTWDDHEVDNNWAANVPQDPDLQSSMEFAVRRAAAFQAYYEHMPLRRFPTPQTDFRLYGQKDFGDLVRIHLLDTRQYRSDQVCARGDIQYTDCPERQDDSRTLLGATQERWLHSRLESSKARWNVLAQQIWLGSFDYGQGPKKEYNRDAWDGYAAERGRLLDLIEARRVANPVVLSGDWHCSCVQDVRRDPLDPGSPALMTELAGTSISSHCSWADSVEQALSENPQVRFFDGEQRGYVRCSVTPERWQADYRFVSSVQDTNAARIRTGASFVVESGHAGAQEA